MTRFHNVDGEKIPFTAEEETHRDAEEQAHADYIIANPHELKVWQKQINKTDKNMPRYVEDLYDTGITPSDRTKKLIDDKKALRAVRP